MINAKKRTQLKKLRIESSYTQKDVATMLHLSQQAYAKLEQGKTELDEERKQKLAELFKKPIEEVHNKVIDDNEPSIVMHNSSENIINNQYVTIERANTQEIIEQLKEAFQIALRAKDELISHLRNSLETNKI